MHPERLIRRSFFRSLIATARGRAHLLNLMVHAEEGDEAGVFERLHDVLEDPRHRRTVARHRADELMHAGLFRQCLARQHVEPPLVPSGLLIIRRVAHVAGGAFREGAKDSSAHRLRSRRDIMETFALLLAIEQRGVEQFPLIGAEFARIGDPETARTCERVAKDELRHTKYCMAIGRHHADSEREWERVVAHFRRIEARAFQQAALAGLAYAVTSGLAWSGPMTRPLAAALRAFDPMPGAAEPAVLHA